MLSRLAYYHAMEGLVQTRGDEAPHICNLDAVSRILYTRSVLLLRATGIQNVVFWRFHEQI